MSRSARRIGCGRSPSNVRMVDDGMNGPAEPVSDTGVDRLERLGVTVATARRTDLDRYRRFFEALNPRLSGARAVQAEFDRMLAARFNVLDYLRTDELGLSRIVGDLLDPHGTHGQGPAFLKAFVCLLEAEGRLAEVDSRSLDECDVHVVRERTITDGRRIDISVEIRPRSGLPLCIAVENKPYADDEENQVSDYLRFLRHTYCARFLLIYLTPHGQRPSYGSLAADARTDRLATLPYYPRPLDATDGDGSSRLRFSLAKWLRDCRRVCDVDRLRWFLRDAENFCHRTFGGSMTTHGEHEAVREFILASDDNVQTAIAVAEAWPETRNVVVRRFLAALHAEAERQVRAELGSVAEDLVFGSYFANRSQQDGVWACRKEWRRGARKACPYVWLAHEGDAAKWHVGVAMSPRNCDPELYERLRERLRRDLPGGSSDDTWCWPWYRYTEEHGTWSPLVARLYEEAQQPAPGEPLAYFRDRFAEVAKAAVPAIDDVLAVDD